MGEHLRLPDNTNLRGGRQATEIFKVLRDRVRATEDCVLVQAFCGMEALRLVEPDRDCPEKSQVLVAFSSPREAGIFTHIILPALGKQDEGPVCDKATLTEPEHSLKTTLDVLRAHSEQSEAAPNDKPANPFFVRRFLSEIDIVLVFQAMMFAPMQAQKEAKSLLAKWMAVGV